MGKIKNTFRILVGRPFGKCSPGRLSNRHEDNIKLILGRLVLKIGDG
jgi:hypothetical protein